MFSNIVDISDFNKNIQCCGFNKNMDSKQRQLFWDGLLWKGVNKWSSNWWTKQRKRWTVRMGEIMGYFYADRNVRIESVNGMM